MGLRRRFIFEKTQGFTYAEILLAIGLLAVLLAATVPMGIGYVRTEGLISQRDMLTELLLAARSRAYAHIGQGGYGVYIDDTKYVLFQGEAFTEGLPTNETTTLSGTVNHVPEPLVVIFAPLSARSTDTTVTMESNGHTTSIHINSEGAIE